jgi:putative ABC transport system permease protein
MKPAELKVVGKLVWAHAQQHPGRILLTVMSTIASACVVVWVVSGYDSLAGSFHEFAENYLGRYAAVALPASGEATDLPSGRFNRHLNKEFLEALSRDPAVAAVDPIFEARARFAKVGATNADDAENGKASGKRGAALARGPRGNSGGNSSGGEAETPSANPYGAESASSGPRIMGGVEQLRLQSRTPMLVGTDAADPPHRLLEGKWIDARQPDRMEAAISHDSAEQMNVKVGDELTVTSITGRNPSTVKIVGILEQPKRLPPPKFMVGLPPSREAALQGGPASAAVYVPTLLAEKLTGAPAQISYAGIVLKNGVKPDDFGASWADRCAALSPPVEIRTLDNVGQEIDSSTTFEGVRAQAYSATGISLLAALFIIFTTLSMGVHERIRQFAVLRAISLTKWQVAAMIALESGMLGLIGWGGGLLAGWGLLTVMSRLKPASVAEGASLGFWCILLSGLCALGGSLAAAILPAWRATSVSPLDAMAPRQRTHSARFSWVTTVIGLLLISVNPLVVFYIPMADNARYGMAAALGCVAMAIGFILLAPLAIMATEKFLGPPVARLLGLQPRLLATQLTTNMWRTLGTTIALTLGLGLFVAMQTWGYSMLGPFTPGDWAPDAVINITPLGVPDSEIEAVRNIKGINPAKCAPLAVMQTKFAEDLTGFKERASATRQDSCVMIGVDPDIALGGDKPLFDFNFAEGTRAEALAKLKQGRYCLVPDHFQRESGLGIGGKFKVVPPDRPEELVEYEIAGVVSMPGWHWLTKTGFRRGRAAGLMFASFDEVRRDFNTGPTTLFWLDFDGTQYEAEIKAALQPIADRNYDPQLALRQPRNPLDSSYLRPPGFARPRGANVNLITAESVRTQIRQRADGIIWALSQLPLVTLLVTGLGVINTILSSVCARRWDLGVLRALGVTRFALFRIIIAEALLIGIVACVLSFSFGTMAGYCGTGVTRYINIRGGQITPLIIPWTQLMVGFGITLSLCLIAALIPAIKTGRTEPLQLLQAGRMAM